jgi:uncharacterized membrane protein
MEKARYRKLTKNLGEKKPRVPEVDVLRGMPILIVVLYHFLFDFTMIPQVTTNYLSTALRYPGFDTLIQWATNLFYSDIIHEVWVPFFGGAFLFACGVSTALSHNNLRRSGLLWAAALLVSLATWAASAISGSDLFIGYGILHVMATAILIYALIELFFRKALKRNVPPLLMLAIGVVVLFLGNALIIGYPLPSGSITHWPTMVVTGGPIAEFQAAPFAFFYSALGKYANTVDWWPFLPFGGVIFIGIALGLALYAPKKESVMPYLRRVPVLKPIEFIGSHTLWVYILHQPILIGILGLVLLGMGFRI